MSFFRALAAFECTALEHEATNGRTLTKAFRDFEVALLGGANEIAWARDTSVQFLVPYEFLA